jgi:hypothetical protein
MVGDSFRTSVVISSTSTIFGIISQSIIDSTFVSSALATCHEKYSLSIIEMKSITYANTAFATRDGIEAVFNA